MSRDHVAAYFMAMLYDTGLGGVHDHMRACALFTRASLDRGPLGQQAEALMRPLSATMSSDEFLECTMLASVGFDHGFEPVTFDLEPGHWMSIDVHRTRIWYGGDEKTIEHGLASSGRKFLPIEHVELTVGRARSERRHFINCFAWTPDAGQRWTLVWHLSEVVRNDLVAIVTEALTTIDADMPPASFDVHQFARLRTNHSGNVEWAIVRGPNRRSGIVTHEVVKKPSQ